MDSDWFSEVSDAEPLSLEQENALLGDSSQVSMATVEIQAGALPQDVTKGVVLPSVLGPSDDSVNTLGVQLGLDTTAAENFPLPVSGDEANIGLDEPLQEERMDVVVESTEQGELVYPLMNTNVPFTGHPIEMWFSLFALQEILGGRLANKSISHESYKLDTSLICDTKFDEEERASVASIRDIPKDVSCYVAILAALGFEPLTLPIGTKVVPVTSQAVQSDKLP